MKTIRFLLSITSAFFFFSCSYTPKESSVMLSGTSLTSLNENAETGTLSQDGENASAFFSFPEEVLTELTRRKLSQEGVSVCVTIRKTDAASEGNFCFSFLYDGDLTKSGKLKNSETLTERPMTRGILSASEKDSVKVSMCLSKTKNERGFYITSNTPVFIEKAEFLNAKAGWDRDENLFSFSDKGGTTDFNFSKCSIENAGEYFSSTASGEKREPLISITFYDRLNALDEADPQKQKEVIAAFGSEEFSIRLSKNTGTKFFHKKALKKMPETISLLRAGECIKSIFIVYDETEITSETEEVLTPIKTDLGLITEWPRSSWRCSEYELFEWDMFPHVLFFDFADYNIQNKFLTRLAFFAEKTGYKGTLVSNYIVETQHGYNAHDYKAEDLAAFFSLAHKTKFSLNKRELLLKKILTANRIIIPESDGTFSKGEGSIISISRESPSYLREKFLAHESWHGIYFTDPDFRYFVKNVYNSFPEDSMSFIKTYWEYAPGLGYDRSDEYLMQNEFMAYIMQQDISTVKGYFTGLTNRNTVAEKCPELGEYVRNTNAADFYSAAQKLNSYAFNTWGLAAGRVQLVTRLTAR